MASPLIRIVQIFEAFVEAHRKSKMSVAVSSAQKYRFSKASDVSKIKSQADESARMKRTFVRFWR